MTKTWWDVVNELVSEYKANGEKAAIAKFDAVIKAEKLRQSTIKAIIVEFRVRVAGN